MLGLASIFSCLVFFFHLIVIIFSTPSNAIPSQDPKLIVQDVQSKINSSRRSLKYRPCGTGNPIDDCWRCDTDWANNRERLADCAIGFGLNAMGGKGGKIYIVTNSSDQDPVHPSPGTLRYALIQTHPLWIIFQHDMVITIEHSLDINSYKTIDGRGAIVNITGSGCITINRAHNIIIHGIHIHDCKQVGNNGTRRSKGDGISMRGAKHIWVDHCSLSNCYDGLIDATRGSTYITISNNYMTNHSKVMLLGHNDAYVRDKNMQVTVAFNHFGEGLVQRMPRCRHGYFHVVNNDYTHWEIYAIGGSASPTILSEGNRFLAPDDSSLKEVTKHWNAPESEWKNWNWTSKGDLMLNGAFFRESGVGANASYTNTYNLSARPSHLVGLMTMGAGVLNCKKGCRC